jgi:hypothetical protein
VDAFLCLAVRHSLHLVEERPERNCAHCFVFGIDDAIDELEEQLDDIGLHAQAPKSLYQLEFHSKRVNVSNI